MLDNPHFQLTMVFLLQVMLGVVIPLNEVRRALDDTHDKRRLKALVSKKVKLLVGRQIELWRVCLSRSNSNITPGQGVAASCRVLATFPVVSAVIESVVVGLQPQLHTQVYTGTAAIGLLIWAGFAEKTGREGWWGNHLSVLWTTLKFSRVKSIHDLGTLVDATIKAQDARLLKKFGPVAFNGAVDKVEVYFSPAAIKLVEESVDDGKKDPPTSENDVPSISIEDNASVPPTAVTLERQLSEVKE